jgi:hypothetical protein
MAGSASRDQRIGAIGAIQALPELIVEGSWGLRLNREHVRTQTDGIVDKIYQDAAFRYARDYSASDHCAELMADKGMYALFGSTDLLKRTALLGLVASLNSYRERIDQVFRERGYDLQDTLHQLSQCWDRHGFPPVVMDTGGEGSLLVPLI